MYVPTATMQTHAGHRGLYTAHGVEEERPSVGVAAQGKTQDKTFWVKKYVECVWKSSETGDKERDE